MAALSLVLGASLLAACGSGAGQAQTSTGPGPTASSPPPTASPDGSGSESVCGPSGGKAVPADAALVLRRYVRLLADGRVVAAQRLAAPASPAAAADGASALASLAPRITALDDHY